MAAVLTAADLLGLVPIKLDGQSVITTAIADASIAKYQSRFEAVAEDRGYSSTNCQDTGHRLNADCVDYVGLMAGREMLGLFVRFSDGYREQLREMRTDAQAILDRLEKSPDSAAGADALARGDKNPNRPSSLLSRVTLRTPANVRESCRRTRQI